MPIKDAGASLSFSEINDELGESSTNTLDILSAAQQFTGLLDDDSISMNEFYGLTFQAGSGTYGTRNSHAFRFVIEGDGTKKGFADGQLVDAAENDDTGLNSGDAVSGQSDFVDDYINNDLTNGDTVFAAASGDTKTNLRPGGDFASGTHFMLDTTANDIFQIDSNADVSNVVSRVPSNPSHSMTARDSDEITIKITSDTIVTRDLLLYRGGTFIDNILPTSSGSIGNTGVDTNFTYTGLSAGTSYTIGVRQANTHDSSSLITADYSTTAAATSWGSIGDFDLHLGTGGASAQSTESPQKSLTLTNGSGNTTISIEQPSNTSPAHELLIKVGNASNNFNLISTYTTSPSAIAAASTYFMKFKLQQVGSKTNTAEDCTVTFTNNSVQRSFEVNVEITSGVGGLCIHELMLVDTPMGQKSIYDLNVGDLVSSYNYELDIVEDVPIQEIIKPMHKNLYKVNSLILTEDHPIFDIDGKLLSINTELSKQRYGLDTEKLEIGHTLKTLNNEQLVVDKIRKYNGEHKTYTILTKNNNFFVDGILVHSEI